MTSKPSIVIVHGSWVNPSFYDPLVQRLKALGYPTVCPLLSSCSPAATVDTDLIDDALAIRSVLTRLIEYEKRSVVLLSHSYGGLVGSEAVPEELTTTSRQKQGLAGGVQYLIYAGAFMLPPGGSCQSVFGDMPGSKVENGFYTDPDAKNRMFNDFPSDEADAWVAKLIRHPFKVQQTATTRAAYAYTPSTYIVFTNDGACPPAFQEQFAGAMRSKVVKFESGHMGPLSHGEKLGDVVDEVIQSIP